MRRILMCCLLVSLAACSSSEPATTSAPGNPKVPAGAKSSGGHHAVIETAQGPIEIEFLPDAPKAAENFRLLAEHGYYDGLTFHRIIKGFMLQGGDPLGTGQGGDSAWGGTFDDEINPNAPVYQAGYVRGIVAMANRGPNTNGSQFFIMHAEYPMPPNYVIFAKVVKGFEAVDAIANLPMTLGRDGNMSSPLTPVVMTKVTVKP
jgi:cyclophilin family peptidyl-prolyl cis-trans isomerase